MRNTLVQWDEYARSLRAFLGIAEGALTEEILSLIVDEGWTPNLFSQEVDDALLWACPVARGIFRTVQQDPRTGMMGQEGRPTAELAALEGLRRARGLNLPEAPGPKVEQFSEPVDSEPIESRQVP